MASRIPRIACPDPALPRSRREEVGSLARVYARFAPNLGRGAGHQGWANLGRRVIPVEQMSCFSGTAIILKGPQVAGARSPRP